MVAGIADYTRNRRALPGFKPLRRPTKCGGEAGDLRGEKIRFRGDDVEQFVCEEHVDGLTVAFCETLRCEDLEAGEANLQVGEAEEFVDAFREVGAERLFDRF